MNEVSFAASIGKAGGAKGMLGGQRHINLPKSEQHDILGS